MHKARVPLGLKPELVYHNDVVNSFVNKQIRGGWGLEPHPHIFAVPPPPSYRQCIKKGCIDGLFSQAFLSGQDMSERPVLGKDFMWCIPVSKVRV
jgi:hypothetical protein